MKTIMVRIEDTIFERVMAFLKLFPEDKLKVIAEKSRVTFVNEAEQREIDELLRDPECFEAEEQVLVAL